MPNVIFDIGNVVIRWQPYNALSHIFSDEASMNEALKRIGFFEWNVEQDRGRSWADGLAKINQKMPEQAHIFEAYVKGLDVAHSELIPGTSELIQRLHENGVGLFGLTNASLETFEIMKRTAPNIALFRHTSVSAAIRMIKPSPEIFEYCMTENGIDKSDTVFVDDTLENCLGAEEIGLHAHHFSSADNLLLTLKSLGIL